MRHLGVCCFLDRPEDGAAFAASAIPLHVTTLGNFSVDTELHSVIEAVRRAAVRLPLETSVIGDSRFGADADINVALVTVTDGVRQLHDDVRSSLVALGAELDEPAYAGAGYRPHITWIDSSPFALGEVVRLSTLSLVDLEPDHDPSMRRVVATVSA